jgi:hypothetical protein
VEEQNEALQRAGVQRRLSAASIDARCPPAPSIHPDRRRSAVYADTMTLALPTRASTQSDRRFSYESQTPILLPSQKASGLDLLHAALSTPPTTEPASRNPLSRRGSVASVSFPAFPHDIFHSTEEEASTKSASPGKRPATPTSDPLSSRKRSWASCQGLPPREVLTAL